MALLPNNEIESELSYAYIHAVAAKAGMSCMVANRHMDNLGIDAIITANENFGEGTILTDISLHIQLKATVNKPPIVNNRIPYFFQGIERYNKLRRETVCPPKILVVLFLPNNQDEWLQWSSEKLVLQQCAWWESLRGASECDNGTGVTVYLPIEQEFSPSSLKELMTRLAREEELPYHG